MVSTRYVWHTTRLLFSVLSLVAGMVAPLYLLYGDVTMYFLAG